MKILVIGQATLHWGRAEFGNIGNYYVVEPFFRELHRVFPNAKIMTTLQMSDDFCSKEDVEVLPMNLYYGWEENDVDTALIELSASYVFEKTGFLCRTTPYISEVLKSDLVVDISGDIWGDNANFVGKDRFLVGLCKNRIAQLLGKPTAMLAGSPGPFKEQKTLNFAREVFENFDLVTNREPLSIKLLESEGFDILKVRSLACPAFLFEPAKGEEINTLLEKEGLTDKSKPTVGFIVCGWNFSNGSFDKWPIDDKEYIRFAEAVEFINMDLDARVCLMSHSNGFHIPPEKFELIHGRDYPIAKQLQKVLNARGIANDVMVLDGVYTPWETKAIIAQFNMLVSGRIHGAVAALSQNVPTVIIDYGQEPKAHKLVGFAKVAEVEDFVADPSRSDDLNEKIKDCWDKRESVKNHLIKRIPKVKELSKMNFDVLKQIISP